MDPNKNGLGLYIPWRGGGRTYIISHEFPGLFLNMFTIETNYVKKGVRSTSMIERTPFLTEFVSTVRRRKKRN